MILPALGISAASVYYFRTALSGISEILRRCRKVVGHFKHSVVAQNALEESQTKLNLPQHKLVQDVMTRWNSSYNMLQRIIEQETALSAVLAESGKAAHCDMILASTEVSKIQCIASVLRPLAQATTLLGAEKSPSNSCPAHSYSNFKEALTNLRHRTQTCHRSENCNCSINQPALL